MISIRETEHWALRVLNALDARTFGEDALVELKRDWPRDAYRAARRIAGHANAARGREVLWIIGVDEQAGIVGAEASDMASWMPQVWQHFEEAHPAMVDVQVEFSTKRCTALAFDTSRPPYVVKNPEFGARAGVVIEREVPWRDGTRIRSATREEILRLLINTVMAPSVEVFSAEGSLNNAAIQHKRDGYVGVRFRIEFYIMPRTADPLVIPYHTIKSFIIPSSDATPQPLRVFHHTSRQAERVARQRAGAFARSPVAVVQSEPHFGVEDTGSEILVTRATHIFCHADAELPEKSWSNSQSFAIQINYLIGPERVPFVVACTGTKQTTSTDGRILPAGLTDDLMV